MNVTLALGVGTLLGLLLSLPLMQAIDRQSEYWARVLLGRFNTAKPEKPSRWFRVLSHHLTSCVWLLPVTAMLNPMGLAAFMGESSQWMFIVYCASFGFTASLAIGASLFGEAEHRKHMLARVAMQQTLRGYKMEEILALIKEYSSNQDEELRAIGVEALRNLVAAGAFRYNTASLQQLPSDLRASVADSTPEEPPKTIPATAASLTDVILEYRLALRQRFKPSAQEIEYQFDAKHLAATGQRVDELLRPYLPQFMSYPRVVCLRCFLRPSIMSHLEWSWLRCPKCLSRTTLQAGIAQVIGCIGGSDLATKEGTTLLIPNWSETQKQVLHADAALDGLRIYAGAPIDYDWAISKVYEALNGRFTQQRVQFQIRLLGNPAISLNSRRLLEELGKLVEA